MLLIVIEGKYLFLLKFIANELLSTTVQRIQKKLGDRGNRQSTPIKSVAEDEKHNTILLLVGRNLQRFL